MPDGLDLNQPAAARTLGTDLERANASLIDRLRLALPIVDAATLAQRVLDRETIAGYVAARRAFIEPIKRMAHQLHAAIVEREHILVDPLLVADRAIANEIRDYHIEEQAERRRREQEAAEAARRDREAEAATEAAALEHVGDTALAEAIIADAIAQPAPIVALPDPTAGIVSFTRRWKWKYAGGPMDVSHTPPDVRLRALARLPIEFHMADEKKIGAYVRSMKGSGSIDGVDIYYLDEPNR